MDGDHDVDDLPSTNLVDPNPPWSALLVSIHDVSPLTLENSQRAVEVALEAGVPGWGSLNAVEASVTCWWADIQRRRAPVDTRLAIHPTDMGRARTLASIRRALASLVGGMAMLSYRDYLAR